MIRAAFFDIDGTLQSFKTKQMPLSARNAIAKLQEKGIKCIVATGRQLGVLGNLSVGDIPFDAYLTLNGQMLHDREKNLIHGVPIRGTAKDYLLRCFEAHTFPAMLVEERDVYVNFVDDHVESVSRWLASPNPPVREYSGKEIYQVNAYLKPEQEHFLDPIRDYCNFSRWHYGGMDVIAKGGGKMVGIQRYLEREGISREETIAFGDAENDREMLRFAGIGVAMGNADAETKAAADYVTSSVEEDGIQKALEHFELI